MHPNERTIHTFYEAFARRDAKAMAACYRRDCTFSDPVFPRLQGEDVHRMWAMLCASAQDLEVTHGAVIADDNAGSCIWEARYTFSRGGRKVHNRITANFEFRDGRILHHVDSFGFWRWSRQALGPTGWLLGWTPMVRSKVRRQAAQRLAAFGDPARKATAKPKPSKKR